MSDIDENEELKIKNSINELIEKAKIASKNI